VLEARHAQREPVLPRLREHERTDGDDACTSVELERLNALRAAGDRERGGAGRRPAEPEGDVPRVWTRFTIGVPIFRMSNGGAVRADVNCACVTAGASVGRPPWSPVAALANRPLVAATAARRTTRFMASGGYSRSAVADNGRRAKLQERPTGA